MNTGCLTFRLGVAILGALVLFAPRSTADSSTSLVAIGGYGGTYKQPFSADLTLKGGPNAQGGTLLSLSRPVFHIPTLQPVGSTSPFGTVTYSGNSADVVDVLNGNTFQFRYMSPPPSDPPAPDPADFPDNHAPIAINPTLVSSGREALRIPMLSLADDPDGDPITITVKTKAQWGVLAVESDQLTYIPFGAYAAGDTFALEIRDGYGGVSQSNVTLVNPLMRFAGSYSGIIGKTGSLDATINRQGVGTVSIRMNGRRYRGIVEFPNSGPTTATLTSISGASINVSLEPIPTATLALRLVITIRGETVAIDCPKIPADLFVIDYIGQYNLGLSSSKRTSYAIVKINPAGTVRVIGCLPTGKPWTAATQLEQAGKVRFEVSSAKGTHLLSGDLILPPVSASSKTVEAGHITWDRPSGSISLNAFGGRFEAVTVRGQNIFGSSLSKFGFSIQSPVVTKTETRFNGNGLFLTPVKVHADDTRLAVDGFNRVSQIRPGPTLTTLTLKRNGRFTGVYSQGGDIPYIPFHGVFYSPTGGLGLISNGPGSVSIYE